MSEDINTPDATPESSSRKPRVALMGEFSAGKSTLTNLLLGAEPLPVQITATRLPPVWITQGDGRGLREDINGDIHDLTDGGLADVRIEETRLIQLQMQADILQLCDLVDMPGISDPNMDAQVWRHVIDEADVLIWCTHATQAWRQSEAAAFDSLPEHLRARSILLITRADKLQNDRDRRRVMARVKAETGDRFRAIYPVALLDAVLAGEDRDRWNRSGAEPFIKTLIDLLTNPDATITPVENTDADTASTPEPTGTVTPVRPARVTSSSDGTRRARPASSPSTASTGAVRHG